MKKQWISVKCGLSRDPKHRQAMGESVWLFLHILDVASWDDGIAHEWKDEDAAEDMGMPIRTLREHRRRLDELGYISCVQKQYNQDIIIHNWTNPREYGGQKYNEKQGGSETSPQDEAQGYIQGDTQGYIQGSRKDVTPTLYSKNQISLGTLTDEEKNQANAKVDAILDMANFPGAKAEARRNSILSYLGERLHVNTETKAWREFAKYADGQQQKGEKIEVFIAWLLGQDKFQIQYWPPRRMMEMWPQAFIQEAKSTLEDSGWK